MEKNRLFKMISATTLAGIMFVGCGGGSSGGTSTAVTTPTALTGTFIDAPVKGLHYKTATQEGDTNDSGEFKYLSGETIEFKLGTLSIGSVSADALITPYTLAGDTDISNPSNKALNIALLLQNFDADRTDGILDVLKLKDMDLSNFKLDDTLLDMEGKISTKLADNSFVTSAGILTTTLINSATAKTAMKMNVELKKKELGYFSENNITYSGNVNINNSADLLKQMHTSLQLLSALTGSIESMPNIRPRFTYFSLTEDGSNVNYSVIEIKQDYSSNSYIREEESDTIEKSQYNNYVTANENVLTHNYPDWYAKDTISSARYVSNIAGVSLHKGVIEITYREEESGTSFDRDEWTTAGQNQGTATTIQEYVEQAISNKWGRDGNCWVDLGPNGTILDRDSNPVQGASWKIENNVLEEIIPNCRDARYIMDNKVLKHKWFGTYYKDYVGVTKEEAQSILNALVPANTLQF